MTIEQTGEQTRSGIRESFLARAPDEAGQAVEHSWPLLSNRIGQLPCAAGAGRRIGKAREDCGNGAHDCLVGDGAVKTESGRDLRDHIGRQELHDGETRLLAIEILHVCSSRVAARQSEMDGQTSADDTVSRLPIVAGTILQEGYGVRSGPNQCTNGTKAYTNVSSVRIARSQVFG